MIVVNTPLIRFYDIIMFENVADGGLDVGQGDSITGELDLGSGHNRRDNNHVISPRQWHDLN